MEQRYFVLEGELGVLLGGDLGHFLGFGAGPHVLGSGVPGVGVRLGELVGEAVASGVLVGVVVVEGKEVLVDVLLKDVLVGLLVECHGVVKHLGFGVHVDHNFFEAA